MHGLILQFEVRILNFISNLPPLGGLSNTLAPQPILGHMEELWTPKAPIPGPPPLLIPEGERALMLQLHGRASVWISLEAGQAAALIPTLTCTCSLQ